MSKHLFGSRLRDRLQPMTESQVYIVSGPFSGFRGVVEAVDGSSACVRVALKNGRSVLFELDCTELEVEFKRRPAGPLRRTGNAALETTVVEFTQLQPKLAAEDESTNLLRFDESSPE